jgi:methionyl-tRNA formyltransferase
MEKKLRLIIVTGSLHGLAAHHLPFLLAQKEAEVAGVLLSGGTVKSKKAHFKRKVKKAWQIGLLGTLNGFRMRKWFGRDVADAFNIISLKDICQQHHIPLFETSVLNSDETRTLLKAGNYDLGLSLGNGFIAPSVFSIPRFGMINIHHEELPGYQNAQSVLWQLYNGSSHSGYTIHKVETKIDGGAILYRQTVPIIFKDTLAKTVTATIVELYQQSAIGLCRVLSHFEEYLHAAEPQQGGSKYTTPSITQFVKMVRQYRRLKKSMASHNNTHQTKTDG